MIKCVLQFLRMSFLFSPSICPGGLVFLSRLQRLSYAMKELNKFENSPVSIWPDSFSELCRVMIKTRNRSWGLTTFTEIPSDRGFSFFLNGLAIMWFFETLFSSRFLFDIAKSFNQRWPLPPRSFNNNWTFRMRNEEEKVLIWALKRKDLFLEFRLLSSIDDSKSAKRRKPLSDMISGPARDPSSLMPMRLVLDFFSGLQLLLAFWAINPHHSFPFDKTRKRKKRTKGWEMPAGGTRPWHPKSPFFGRNPSLIHFDRPWKS